MAAEAGPVDPLERVRVRVVVGVAERLWRFGVGDIVGGGSGNGENGSSGFGEGFENEGAEERERESPEEEEGHSGDLEMERWKIDREEFGL